MTRIRRAGIVGAALGVLTACTGDSVAPDGEAPSVWLAVSPCCIVTTPGTRLTLTAGVNDNIGVQHVAFLSRAPGDSVATQFADDSSAPYRAEYPSGGFTVGRDGAYEVSAKAYDASGNSAISTASVTLDLTPPTVTISVLAGRVTFGVAFPVTVNASEPLQQIDLYDRDSLVASAYEPMLPRTLFETFSKAHNGVRVFTARVRDRAGNEAVSAPDTVVVDIRWTWDVTPVIDQSSWFNAVAVSGNAVYTTGTQFVSGITFADAVIYKVDSAGVVLWSRVFGAAGISDLATSLAVNANGDAYIAVWRIRPSSSYDRDCILVKYSASGQELWNRIIDSRDDEESCRVAVDDAGSAYLAFARVPLVDSVSVGGTPETYLAKYDAAGNQLWLRSVAPLFTRSTDDRAAIAIDPSGNVYLTGVMQDPLNPVVGFSAVLLKLDGAGNELWKRFPGGYMADAPGITLDSIGGIYAIGTNDGSLDSLAGVGGTYIVRYDASGGTVWQRQLRFQDRVDSTASVIHGEGVYVAGFALGPFPRLYSDGAENIFIARVTGDGRLADFRTYGRRGWVEGYAVAADNSGAAYVAGMLRDYQLGLLLKHRP